MDKPNPKYDTKFMDEAKPEKGMEFVFEKREAKYGKDATWFGKNKKVSEVEDMWKWKEKQD